ncbi:MAG: DUF1795 domain-containing protein [Actinomycetota bacterium]|nr:DUF1795 domain-containing protein [Actinomycetota bacterium]
MAQSGNCDQFRVGTKAWTDCVHDSATGGGLMPWIVVIPLAVMVLGMFVGFARQFSRRGQQRAREHGVAGSAGSWLIFVSFIELAIGIGSRVAAQRAPGEGGGYDISSTILLGVGVLLFVVGVFLKARGRRRARIYNTGLPGEALIRDVRETGTVVNNQPMYEFDLDVTGSGFAPTSTTHREVIPFWFANRVGPQSNVPVKVDPSNPGRLIFDWDRFRATAPVQVPAGGAPATAVGASGFAETSGGTATPGEAANVLMSGADALADAMQAARQFGSGGPGWHVGKAIGAAVLLFVIAIVGGGLYFISSIFDTVSDTTNEVTEQVEDARDEAGRITGGAGAGAGSSRPTTVAVSRTAAGRRPVAYAVELPVGWLDLTAAEEERVGPLVVDVVLKPVTPSEARIVVTRSVRFLEDPAPEDADITSIRREMLAEYGDRLAGTAPARLAGEPAIRIDIAPGTDGLRSRQVAVMRGGQVLFASVTAKEPEWRAVLPVFGDVLASWKWK